VLDIANSKARKLQDCCADDGCSEQFNPQPSAGRGFHVVSRPTTFSSILVSRTVCGVAQPVQSGISDDLCEGAE
jgi:hypothetical protein